MNVLHLSSDFLYTPLYLELLSRIERDGIYNILYSPVAYHTAHGELPTNIIISKCFHKYDSIFYGLKQGKILRDVYPRFAMEQFDLLHAHFLFSNGFTAMRIKERYNIPYVAAVRNTDLNVFFKRMLHLRKTGLRILKEARMIVFLSDAYRKQLLQSYAPRKMHDEIMNKSVIIPNGIDAFWLKNRNLPQMIEDSRKIKIISAGTIEKNKNHITTLDACRLLRNNGYDVEFTIVGQSRDDALLARLLKESFVKYVPNQPKEALIQLYRNSDIFVMPSIQETFGLVYAEAISQGLPLIYTRGQGFDRQFDDGAVGYAVNCFDSAEIAEKLLLIVNHYSAISERCIAGAGRYDWNIIAQTYINMYQKCLN